jgi:hypothetical protein
MPHFTQHYDIGGHTVKQVENEAQNFAEYFLSSPNRCIQKTGGL